MSVEASAMTGSLQNNGANPQYEGVRQPLLDASRPTPLEWIRQRTIAREARRADAAGKRLATRSSGLGEGWQALDLNHTATGESDAFVAIGPGGIFTITCKKHGRSAILLAGDVVEVNGRLYRYITEARRNAAITKAALSLAAGVTVPVVPVLAFVGSGALQVHGLPRSCLVTPYRDLDRLLTARADRLSTDTATKLFALASHPETWAGMLNDTHRLSRPAVGAADHDRAADAGPRPSIGKGESVLGQRGGQDANRLRPDPVQGQ
jgi:hypothetical protein